jgi:nicotinate-nucleotide adenylyltransferase
VARHGDAPTPGAASLPSGAGVDVITVPRIDISSTMIRRRMALGRPIDFYVPDPVARVLREEGLVPSAGS